MRIALASALVLLTACASPAPAPRAMPDNQDAPFIVVLGTAQDGGYPQSGCAKACCVRSWNDPSARRYVAALGLVDPASGSRWLFDATPDFRDQLRLLDSVHPVEGRPPGLSGIFLTHAHIGHYTGLTMLGREAVGAAGVPVFALPRMKSFLEANGPWDQLVRLGNVSLLPLAANGLIRLPSGLAVETLLVPHRDEYSETAAFVIVGPSRSVLFVPDIDKWEKWETKIEDVIARVDVAYVDGTFFENGEIPGRDMSEIPHPFIEESMKRFSSLPASERAKVRFIHLNHTNPALVPDSEARRRIQKRGFRVAEQGETIRL